MESLDAQVMGWFEWLHAHPERSWHEQETTAYLAAQLDALGVGYRALPGGTGLIADLPAGGAHDDARRRGSAEGPRGPGPSGDVASDGGAVALRADLDAIWHGSEEDGHAAHTCGHSAHMAAVLGAVAELLRQPAARPVRVLFQPAEETGDGALRLIADGALDGVGAILGVHLRPEEDLVTGLAPALLNGASAQAEVTFTGEPAHAARPHLGRNPVDALVSLHALLGRLHVAPAESWSAKITVCRAGGHTWNVIPESAYAVVDVCAQRNPVLAALREEITVGVEGIAALHGMEAAMTWEIGTPAAEVDPGAENALREAILAVVPDSLADPVVTPGADDFHFYTDGTGVRGAMLAVGCHFTPGLHHPDATFDASVLPTVARVLAEAARRV